MFIDIPFEVCAVCAAIHARPVNTPDRYFPFHIVCDVRVRVRARAGNIYLVQNRIESNRMMNNDDL